MLPADPAARHQVVARTFTARVEGVRDWGAPTPVAGWTARDVVGHLVGWLPGFLAGGTPHTWRPGPPVEDDPVAAWLAQVEGVQEILDDPGAATSSFDHPRLPAQPLSQAIDTFYTADVFMHTWDLARATGQDDTLDPEHCHDLLSGMTAMEDVLRSSGQYGPAWPTDPDAPVQVRLVAFIGRDPRWRPAP